MSTFEELDRRAARDGAGRLGAPATYRRASDGTEIPTVVEIERGLRSYPTEEVPLVPGPLDVAHVLLEDVPAPERGDEVVVGDDVFTVVEELAKDGAVADLRVQTTG